MADTIAVQSTAHGPMRITEPLPEEFRAKPGLAPELKSVVINGANHAEARYGVGVTKDVDAELFHKWLDEAKRAGDPRATMFKEMSPDEADKPVEMSFGYQPALDAMKADAENTAKAAEGSAVKDTAPLSGAAMAAKSDTPNDDTPRGDPTAPGVVPTQTPATAKVAPAAAKA
jgi:hypothetical protein